jgi:hypothetical protein
MNMGIYRPSSAMASVTIVTAAGEDFDPNSYVYLFIYIIIQLCIPLFIVTWLNSSMFSVMQKGMFVHL